MVRCHDRASVRKPRMCSSRGFQRSMMGDSSSAPPTPPTTTSTASWKKPRSLSFTSSGSHPTDLEDLIRGLYGSQVISGLLGSNQKDWSSLYQCQWEIDHVQTTTFVGNQPFQELKGEISFVPQKSDKPLTRHKFVDETEAAINEQINSVLFLPYLFRTLLEIAMVVWIHASYLFVWIIIGKYIGNL